MYENITILLATKHKKENAIREPFEKELKAKIVVPNDFDTDKFGTFSGEIPRLESAYETVIKKAKQASLSYGINYAIASEGSFGPHPTIFFAPCDIELISFVDLKNDIIVVESELTTETNYAHLDITASDSYIDFLNKVHFSTHGLIVRSIDDNTILAKGITQLDALISILNAFFKNHEKIRLETDMRAMMNPTRMAIINKVAVKLAKRLQNKCKQCETPGFGKPSVKGNLECEACGSKTELYKNKVLSCIKCNYEEYLPRTDGLEISSSTYCPYCNP